MDWLYYEKLYSENGLKTVCGVDEAGRGPLAGSVYAAAVVLPYGKVIDGVNDSKKLTEKKREHLYDVIKKEAKDYSVAFATPEEIEKYNILGATFLAMKRAVGGLKIAPDFTIVDGNRLPDWKYKSCSLIKGDSLSQSVACASILAKVTRDREMKKEAEKYPEYHFEKHKGYGTALHTEMIKKYGPCPIHRKSFLTKIIGK